MMDMQTNSKLKKAGKFFKFLIFGTIAILVMGGIVMWLWNTLLPEIFQLPVISFWQALGLLLLSKILFGSFGNGPGRKGNGFGGPSSFYREKWVSLSEEEKVAFREKWKDRCRPSGTKEEQEG